MSVTQELIDRALAVAPEAEEWMERVGELRRLDDRESYDAIVALTASANAAERALGADVLGQFGCKPHRYGEPLAPHPFADATVDLLLDLIAREDDPNSLQSIAVAFRHLDHPRCIGPLAELRPISCARNNLLRSIP